MQRHRADEFVRKPSRFVGFFFKTLYLDSDKSLQVDNIVIRLKSNFYSYTLYPCLQKIAEKERKYKSDWAILIPVSNEENRHAKCPRGYAWIFDECREGQIPGCLLAWFLIGKEAKGWNG